MSDSEEDNKSNVETLHKMKLRHKEELKELDINIKNLLKLAAKNNTKKAAAEKIKIMEANIKERHEKELASKTGADKLVKQVEAITLMPENREIKISKSELIKQKKELEYKSRLAGYAQDSKDNMIDHRQNEIDKINKLLLPENLKIFSITSDGNCLYHSLVHQLNTLSLIYTMESLRKIAADYIALHSDEFINFIAEDDDVGNLDDPKEMLKLYIERVRSTTLAVWGGEIELVAISNALKVKINLYDDSGKREIGDFDKSVNITFHRHYYGLGYHYNSVVKF